MFATTTAVSQSHCVLWSLLCWNKEKTARRVFKTKKGGNLFFFHAQYPKSVAWQAPLTIMSGLCAHWFSASSFLAPHWRGKVCRFNFAESGGRRFSFSLPLRCCTCLLFILRSEKEGERMVEKTHIRCVSEAALVRHERHFCPALKYIALTSPWCGLPVFHF